MTTNIYDNINMKTKNYFVKMKLLSTTIKVNEKYYSSTTSIYV